MPPGRVGGPIPVNSRLGLNPAADIVLLQRTGAGDRLAFEALYRGYLPRLTRFLQRMMRQPQLIEEVLNDTMLVVWRKAAGFAGQSKVSTWIFSIAYHKALKALNRFDEPVEWDGEGFESTQPEPEDHLIQERRTALLWEHIGRMSPEHRAVIELTYYHGYTYEEIAQIVGCPVNTVKTRMFNARKRLQKMLSDLKEELR